MQAETSRNSLAIRQANMQVPEVYGDRLGKTMCLKHQTVKGRYGMRYDAISTIAYFQYPGGQSTVLQEIARP